MSIPKEQLLDLEKQLITEKVKDSSPEPFEVSSKIPENIKKQEEKQDCKNPKKGFIEGYLDIFKLPNRKYLKNYETTIEFDSYLLSGLLSGLFIPIFFCYTLIELFGSICLVVWLLFLPCSPCFVSMYFGTLLKIILGGLSFICLQILYLILVLPGIFVIVIQLIALNFIGKAASEDTSPIPIDEFFFLKVCIVFIYISMTCSELSQGINSFFYILSISKKVFENRDYFGLIFSSLSLILPGIQIATVFMLCNVSLHAILITDQIMELIANFAGLYVILEFDNIMFKFIDLFPWRTFLQTVISFQVYGISIYNLADKKFLITLFKDLLNLEDSSEDEPEKKEKDCEKEGGKNNEKAEGEKNKEEYLPLGEDQEDFKFNYQKQLGGTLGNLCMSIKIIAMIGMILYFLIGVFCNVQ